MNTKHYTSISQSKKLLELGLNPESAYMFYSHKTVFYNVMEHRLYVDEDDNWHLHQRSEIAFMDTGNEIPCWSLGALLEVIPFNTQTTTSYKNARVDIIYKKEIENSFHTEKAETLLEALIQTICWLLENGFIKKEPKTYSE